MERIVQCCQCRVTWFPANPGVLYRSADNRWWCANWVACKARQDVSL